jgi:hypothetical protein
MSRQSGKSKSGRPMLPLNLKGQNTEVARYGGQVNFEVA